MHYSKLTLIMFYSVKYFKTLFSLLCTLNPLLHYSNLNLSYAGRKIKFVWTQNYINCNVQFIILLRGTHMKIINVWRRQACATLILIRTNYKLETYNRGCHTYTLESHRLRWLEKISRLKFMKKSMKIQQKIFVL